jgi:hypothetical protein
MSNVRPFAMTTNSLLVEHQGKPINMQMATRRTLDPINSWVTWAALEVRDLAPTAKKRTPLPARFLRGLLVWPAIALTLLVSGCAHNLAAHDSGADAFEGSIIDTTALVQINGKTFRGSIDSKEVRSIQLRAEDDDSISCSLIPVSNLVGAADGACMWKGERAFHVYVTPGPPPAFSLHPIERRTRVYSGTFNTFTRQMTLVIGDAIYTGMMVGSLKTGAQGVLRTPDGRELNCSVGGSGVGSCSISSRHQLNLFWKGRFHI